MGVESMEAAGNDRLLFEVSKACLEGRRITEAAWERNAMDARHAKELREVLQQGAAAAVELERRTR